MEYIDLNSYTPILLYSYTFVLSLAGDQEVQVRIFQVKPLT